MIGPEGETMLRECCAKFIEKLNSERPIRNSPQDCETCGSTIIYEIGKIEFQKAQNGVLREDDWQTVDRAIRDAAYLE